MIPSWLIVLGIIALAFCGGFAAGWYCGTGGGTE